MDEIKNLQIARGVRFETRTLFKQIHYYFTQVKQD